MSSDNDFGSIGTYLSKIQLDQYGDQKWSLNFHHLGGSSGPVWEKVGTFTHDSSKDQDVYTDVKTIKEIAWPNGASEPPLYMVSSLHTAWTGNTVDCKDDNKIIHGF